MEPSDELLEQSTQETSEEISQEDLEKVTGGTLKPPIKQPLP
ncbi:MAG TPA: hypothetical protein VKB58_16490 [Terriglobales bacterium]|jgi:hypothetical protein|nr:hypothetical protein [Terriglobales bacterium]